MPRCRYVLHEAVVQSLLVLDDADIARLVAAFEWLAEHGSEPGDYSRLDSRGRRIDFKRWGRFLIGYRCNDAERLLHIVYARRF